MMGFAIDSRSLSFQNQTLFNGRIKMKVITAVLSFSFLTIAIASSFSSEAYAARRGTMSGYDNTYGSTGKCSGGACKVRTPKAPTKPKAQ